MINQIVFWIVAGNKALMGRVIEEREKHLVAVVTGYSHRSGACELGKQWLVLKQTAVVSEL